MEDDQRTVLGYGEGDDAEGQVNDGEETEEEVEEEEDFSGASSMPACSLKVLLVLFKPHYDPR